MKPDPFLPSIVHLMKSAKTEVIRVLIPTLVIDTGVNKNNLTTSGLCGAPAQETQPNHITPAYKTSGG